MIGQTVSHYLILEKIGSGGMGEVYKAQDLKLDRFVALKFLPPELMRDDETKKRFIQEAKAASVLQHKNICTIHEIDETEIPDTTGSKMFICMDYYEGESLKNKIEKEPLKLSNIIEISIQIAQGLACAHESNVIHRDIKPANIMIPDKGESKIVDFGLAKLAGQSKLTQEKTTIGTVAYMSPEQTHGEAIDHRTDIWSLGVLIYEMIIGQLPFKGEYESAVTYSILNEVQEPLTALRTGVPMELERIVNKALIKNPDERYQHVDEMLIDLRSLSKELETGKEPLLTTTDLRIRQSKKRKRTILYGGIAGIVIVILLIIFLLPSKSEYTDKKTIAVLPFENLNKSDEDDYFSDGIAEDILTQLSKIGDLRVISRYAIKQYKNSNKNPRKIGEELNVSSLLVGSIRRSDNKLRIACQLIDAPTESQIWAETYDREMQDIFAIQSEVAQQIAKSLKVKLSPEEKSSIDKKPTENLRAYDYYIKAREYYNHYRQKDNENAIILFKKALELDPAYVLAYAGLGDSYAQRTGRFGLELIWLDSAVTKSQKALSIDPNCAEAYKALGLVYLFKGWLNKSLQASQRAVELNPNYHPAVGNIGWAYFWLGDYFEALKWAKEGLRLDPTGPISYVEVGSVYLGLTDDTRAEFYCNKAMEFQQNFTFAYRDLVFMYISQDKYDRAIFHGQKAVSTEPDNAGAYKWAGDAQLYSGNYKQAKEYYEKSLSISTTVVGTIRSISLNTNLAFTYLKTEQEEQAQKMFSQILDNAKNRIIEGNESPLVPYAIAAINAVQGNNIEAYRWLQKAIDFGWRDYRICQRSPLFKSLHKEQQFIQIMDSLKSMVRKMRVQVKAIETE
ncbi:protein kinase [Bacteroidota bacterium]